MNSTIDTDEALAVFVAEKTVSVEEIHRDRDGRVVARVTIDGRLVNAEIVRSGLAWRYVQFDRRNEFGAIEEDARRHRRGLWADAHPIAPWEWRKTEKDRKTAGKAVGAGR
jgi:endonuclease YncB( thermonuclease family)